MTQIAPYRRTLQIAEDELRTVYPDLVTELKYLDSTTLAGQMARPLVSTAGRMLIVKYDADASQKALVAGTTLGTRPIHLPRALPFIMSMAGGSISGAALSLTDSGCIETRVCIPLVGEDPYPSVPEPYVRWMTGQAIRAGALVEAVVQLTAFCDAGMREQQAAAMCAAGFAPYHALLEDTGAWRAPLFGSSGTNGDAGK